MIINRRRHALRGALVATAVTVAAATAAGTALASGAPSGAEAATRASAEHKAAEAPRAGAFDAQDGPEDMVVFPMFGTHKKTTNLTVFAPTFKGGFARAEDTGVSFSAFSDWIFTANANHGSWALYKDGRLTYNWDDEFDIHEKQVGTGWGTYTTVLSPGSIGGAGDADLLGVDKSGVLWSYLGYPDGRVTARTKVGGGWGAYNQIAGYGDLTGDGKADIVAKDKSGYLWLYKGTGNYKAPFAGRTKIGGGWGAYDRILSAGDLELDGTTDLIARKPNGELYRYSGTGNAAAPFKKPVKIGTGFQNYNLL
ncbi:MULTISPECIES: VCBS repeat-containing protein [unclassified Streptomyces]|uniref:FG-GAP repeat domain-containing protein n=1 Tax=unclassified Streptomyces TaxID=2593676 RepID=UPI0033B93547